MSAHINFLVLAGGAGTRFWPLSRRSNPKQCLELYGSKTMMEQTIDRIKHQSSKAQRYLVYGDHLRHQFESSDALSIVEPSARNTAPAIALGALIADHFDEGSAIAVLPSDHFVGENEAFSSDIILAAELALTGMIVTIGIPPTRPETGFGYIKKGVKIDKGFTVEAFVEKPDFKTASQYLMQGNYVWNAGMFVFTYATLIHEIASQLPKMAAGLSIIKTALVEDPAKSWTDVSEHVLETIKTEFQNFEATSIDFGVMENAENIAVLPASFPWSDLGHWAAMSEVLDPDENQNINHRKSGETFFYNASDNVVSISSDRFVALVGVKNMVLVESEDAILLISKSKCQDVREVVAHLKKTNPNLI